ncbi:EthD family reductase [Capillimicrobium parvum]|uniref:EthD domain-containing protein n=1 Tax=Capillimicrobium parvum TaxID=2884022 RepID=A0A9E7C109_9ACTN|nr:EthD family reductase [Capillimicrobium parvum]UGS36990.1 hypothetical protein DSM104329_03402 [Capillimicrobium parvum]
MIKLSVLYPNGDGITFDHDYYVQTHMPLVQDRLGDALKGVGVDRGVGGVGPGEPPAFVAAGHLMFDSVEDFQTSFGPHAAEIQGDVPNFTNATPTVVVNEVLV